MGGSTDSIFIYVNGSKTVTLSFFFAALRMPFSDANPLPHPHLIHHLIQVYVRRRVQHFDPNAGNNTLDLYSWVFNEEFNKETTQVTRCETELKTGLKYKPSWRGNEVQVDGWGGDTQVRGMRWTNKNKRGGDWPGGWGGHWEQGRANEADRQRSTLKHGGMGTDEKTRSKLGTALQRPWEIHWTSLIFPLDRILLNSFCCLGEDSCHVSPPNSQADWHHKWHA